MAFRTRLRHSQLLSEGHGHPRHQRCHSGHVWRFRSARHLAGRLEVARQQPQLAAGNPAAAGQPWQFPAGSCLPASGSWPALAGSYRGSGYYPASSPWAGHFPRLGLAGSTSRIGRAAHPRTGT